MTGQRPIELERIHGGHQPEQQHWYSGSARQGSQQHLQSDVGKQDTGRLRGVARTVVSEHTCCCKSDAGGV